MTTQLLTADERTRRIRQLNDQLRAFATGGQVLATSGYMSLPETLRDRFSILIAAFGDFTEDNDPHGEHDFGAITLEGQKVFWKIDYYAPDMLHGSDDPADPAVTRRVLTLMLAEEY